MTRIIGGSARGRTLRTPNGTSTRPTSDRVREALFSSLEATFGMLRDVAFLDVYAGSGAVGLEAASRGAAWVTLVERERAAAGVIAANARALGFKDVEVFSGSASSFAAAPPSRVFDVAFFDAPYDVPGASIAAVVAALGGSGWLAPDVAVVVERSRRSEAWAWPAGFAPERDKRYGDTVLWYGRLESVADMPSATAPTASTASTAQVAPAAEVR